MTKPKGYSTCHDCGEKMYPNADQDRWAGGITCSMGTCPDCGREEETLIPIRDWEHASRKKGVMWD